MAASFDRIAKLGMNREAIRLLVRVVRIWSVPDFHNPAQTSSLEMVLADEYGGKIQATVRRALLYKFSPVLDEGAVYKMVYFNVVPNGGNYKATFHEYKLVFLFKTTVMRKECDSIPMYALSCVPFNEVLGFNDNYANLIDVMGVLTAVLPERQYEKEGKLTTMVVIELTDPYGKLECALFGDYVYQLKDFLRAGSNVQVIVVVQLARVKTFRGKIVVQNSMGATKLLLNPDIPEALTFRDSIAEHGVIDVEPLTVVLDSSKEGLECDFLKMHPKKSISQLDQLKEDGIFVVLGKITDIVNDGPWYYVACKCNRSVIVQHNLYFCDSCGVPVLHVSPRFKVKVEVTDDINSAIFVLFDRDVSLLVKKTCEELVMQSFKGVGDNGYPTILDTLVGKRMLFKVETKEYQAMQFEGSYPVRRVCEDEDVVNLFDLAGGEITPNKAMFVPPFPTLLNDVATEKSYVASGDNIAAPICLGDDERGAVPKWMTGKRKLDEEFDSCIVGCSDARGKWSEAVDLGEDEVNGGKVCGLVTVKMEKD